LAQTDRFAAFVAEDKIERDFAPQAFVKAYRGSLTLLLQRCLVLVELSLLLTVNICRVQDQGRKQQDQELA
ncbi:MAG: hypothetical protein ACD_75C01063G0002, partial [uncultured bacterium]